MPSKPKVLLATTCRWFSAARLGIAFARTGCIVEAVSPSRHPLAFTRAASRSYRFDALAPAASLGAAIQESRPDMVIPCDDLAAMHLRRMYGSAVGTPSSTSEDLIALLKRSMGEPPSYLIVGSRGKFLAHAHELGIETPETQEVNSTEEVRAWCMANGFPAVLKADGTSGGQGVKVVRSMEQALSAHRSLYSPVPSAIVLKRTFIDRDLNLLSPWLKRRRHTVTIQKFVSGTDFNIAVASWQGQVVATVGAEVLETWRPNGPASVIRLVPDGEMLRIAQLIAGRLGLSGLFGLDFLVDKTTGRHTLIEINPRATQTAHIPLGAGHDLISALCSAMTGETVEPISITAQDEIALFPLAWQSSHPRVSLQSAFHDIPWEEPNLVRAGEAETQLLSHAKWMQVWMRALQR